MSERLSIDNTEPIGPHLDRKREDKQIHEDLMYLAAQLLHRGAQTEEEARAAQYIFGRFRERTPDVFKDPFSTIESVPNLFGLYFGEFLIVGLIAIWFPGVAAIYGAIVFCGFLAEFMGFAVTSRLLPPFESQNVIARFMAPRPENLIVVTAHYDSGFAQPLTRPEFVRWWRVGLMVVLSSMALVIASCAAEGYANVSGLEMPALVWVRWTAIVALLGSACTMFLTSMNSEEIRGANTNASGVCALMGLGDRLARAPIPNADVWLVATGSHESWMAGMRQLVTGSSYDKAHTYFLNLESVGAGRLTYSTHEGMLQPIACDTVLTDAAERHAGEHGAASAKVSVFPTASHIPLHRGFKAMSLVGLGDEGVPPRWNTVDDVVTGVDRDAIARATRYAESIVRTVAERAPEGGRGM